VPANRATSPFTSGRGLAGLKALNLVSSPPGLPLPGRGVRGSVRLHEQHWLSSRS